MAVCVLRDVMSDEMIDKMSVKTLENTLEDAVNDVFEGMDMDNDFGMTRSEYENEESALDEDAICEKETKECSNKNKDTDNSLNDLLKYYLTLDISDEWRRNLIYEKMKPQLDKLISYIGYKYFASYMSNPMEKEELFEAGHLGIMTVIQSYDPELSAPSSFFFRPILHEMGTHVNKFVHSSTRYNAEMRKKIQLATEKLESRGFKNPTIRHLAIELGVRTSTIRRSLNSIQNSQKQSYDDLYCNSETNYDNAECADLDNLDAVDVSDYGNPFANVIKNEKIENVRKALERLTPTQQICVRYRYGFEGEEMGYADISEATGIPVDVVKKSLARASASLRIDPYIRAGRRADKDAEIQSNLYYEPFSLTPDNIGFSMMNTMEELDVLELDIAN